MDEQKRIESVVQHAVDARLSGLTENPWMAQRVLTASKGETKVTKKISVGLVLVIIAILSIGFAVAASTNLFEFFIKVDGNDYLNQVDHAAQFYDSQTIAIPQDGHYSAAEFTVNQTYYDGQTLIVAYELSEEWIPSEFPTPSNALAEYGDFVTERYLDMPRPFLDYNLSAEDINAFDQKLEQDGAVLLECWGQWIDDNTIMCGETEISASQMNSVHTPEGTTMGYIIFDFPLPQEVQDQEALSVEFTLHRSKSIMYQDESGFYSKGISHYSVKIPLTIRKNANPPETLTGVAALEDGYITVLATMSGFEIKATITITASPERLRELSRGTLSYDLYAGDEKCNSGDAVSTHEETSILTEKAFEKPDDTENLTLVISHQVSDRIESVAIPLSN
ncbi:MAG: hypothetical protein GX096_12795 [Clostridiales bacterium]|nr:hypothetical protein [Clostridiales bacterium]